MIMYYKECECLLCPMFLYYNNYYYYYYHHQNHHSVLHIRTFYSNVSEAGFLSEKLFFKSCVLIGQWTQ